MVPMGAPYGEDKFILQYNLKGGSRVGFMEVRKSSLDAVHSYGLFSYADINKEELVSCYLGKQVENAIKGESKYRLHTDHSYQSVIKV